jgi:hypothetical protein
MVAGSSVIQQFSGYRLPDIWSVRLTGSARGDNSRESGLTAFFADHNVFATSSSPAAVLPAFHASRSFVISSGTCFNS